MSQEMISLNTKKDELEEQRKYLENNGIKVNKNTSKILIKRLYNELVEYSKTGKIPEYLV